MRTMEAEGGRSAAREPASTARLQESHPAREPGAVRARLLAVSTTVLVVAALKWAQPATLPIVFGLFLIAVAWPLESRLSRRLPRWASVVLTLLVFLAVFALFAAALVWSGQQVAEAAPRYAGKMRSIVEGARGWLAGHGLPMLAGGDPSGLGGSGAGPGGSGSSGAGDAALALAKAAAAALSNGLGTLLLAFGVMVLGLIEVPAFQQKARALPGGGARLADAAPRICARFERYVLARTLSSLLNGTVVGLFCLAVGLDLAFVWGLAAFLLNYLPTIGSALAVIPPSLFALVQLDGLGRPLAIFAAIAVIQLVLGNYVEPWIEGRYVFLSPAVVLVSMIFWGWVWGVLGALLSVPLTVGVVIALEEFEPTRWLAALLSGEGIGKAEDGAAGRSGSRA